MSRRQVWVLLKERFDSDGGVLSSPHCVVQSRGELDDVVNSIARNNQYPMRRLGENGWRIGSTEDQGFFGHKPITLRAVQVNARGSLKELLPETADD